MMLEKYNWLEEIEALSKLSKLEFSTTEQQEFIVEFQKIVVFAAKIGELDLKEVAPLVYINTDTENKMREDLVATGISREQALSNAPRKDSDYFRVPKMFDQ